MKLPWETTPRGIRPAEAVDWARWRPLHELAKAYGVSVHRIETLEAQGRIRFQRPPRRGSVFVRRARCQDLVDAPLYGVSDVARFLGWSVSTIQRRAAAGSLVFEQGEAGGPKMSARDVARHLAGTAIGDAPRDLPPALSQVRPTLRTGPRAWLELIRIDKEQREADEREPASFRDPRDEALDAERTVGALASLFGVSKWLVKEQERRGFVRVRSPGRIRLARPSQFLDAPLYLASGAARYLGVSPRTVKSWAAKGRIGFRLHGDLARRRTTPREVALCWSRYRPRRKKKKSRGRTPPVLGPVVPEGEKARGRFCWTTRDRRLEPVDGTGWEKHLTLRELARVLGVGVRRVERLVDAGLVPVRRTGGTGEQGAREALPRDVALIPLYRKAEIAAVLGVHPSTIGRWQREGRLCMYPQPHGSHLRLSPRGLATLIEKRRRDRKRAT